MSNAAGCGMVETGAGEDGNDKHDGGDNIAVGFDAEHIVTVLVVAKSDGALGSGADRNNGVDSSGVDGGGRWITVTGCSVRRLFVEWLRAVFSVLPVPLSSASTWRMPLVSLVVAGISVIVDGGIKILESAAAWGGGGALGSG